MVSIIVGIHTDFKEIYLIAGAAIGYMVGFMMAIDKIHRHIYAKPIDEKTLYETMENIL